MVSKLYVHLTICLKFTSLSPVLTTHSWGVGTWGSKNSTFWAPRPNLDFSELFPIELKLLVAKYCMECILVSKIIQIKLLCKIERCITIELWVHFGTNCTISQTLINGITLHIGVSSLLKCWHKMNVSVPAAGTGSMVPLLFWVVGPENLKKSP